MAEVAGTSAEPGLSEVKRHLDWFAEKGPDGLVAARPSSWEVSYDAPIYLDYRWVAMLDPYELSHHVDVANLREEDVHDRRTWRADLHALPDDGLFDGALFTFVQGTDPDLFFPERGASTKEAKEVCRGCVVREDCLEYALQNGEKFGIWGGMSERERRRIRRARAIARRSAVETA